MTLGIWGLQRVVELTEVQREPAQSQTLTGPFKTALELLKSHVGAMQAATTLAVNGEFVFAAECLSLSFIVCFFL